MKTHNAWPTRRFDAINRDAIDTRPTVTNGCTQQGRFVDQPMPAECGTEIGADGGTWESADAEVMLYLCKLCCGVLAFCAFVWAAT